MCGRYTLKTPAAQLMDLFRVFDFPELTPRYNIAPTQKVLCIRLDENGILQAVMMKWGLIPFWADDQSIGSKMINARGETVAEKPAFRTAFARRRCLIIADGFYEWQKLSTGKKQPWLMEWFDHSPFAMAGLWESWTPKATVGTMSDDPASVVESCSIITTEANSFMSVLHDRMPVILSPESWMAWLSAASGKEQLLGLIKPLEEELLIRTCVSTIVNRPVPDSPDCVQPIDPPEPLVDSSSIGVKKGGSRKKVAVIPSDLPKERDTGERFPGIEHKK